VGVLGLAQGFAGLGFNFLPAEPNSAVATWLFVGFAVCVAVGLLLFFWPQNTEGATQTTTQSGDRNVYVQGQTVHLGSVSTGGEEREATVAKNRAALKTLLWEARNEGLGLRSISKDDTNRKRPAVDDWRQRTHNLIEAAFGAAEAGYFDLPGELIRPVDKHLSRLDETMALADRKRMRSGFDPQEWEGYFSPR
jgi:hypothetical protein